MKTPSVANYFSALQKQFQLQSSVLTDVLPHAGERGRNDEERFREFLSRILPRKYSVGSGFVVCSDPSVPVSRQTDIVLFDEFHNAPLHREIAAHVYPVEIVYATIEVKGRLEKRDLPGIVEAIARLRALGKHRYYISYGAVQKPNAAPGTSIVGQSESHLVVPPRALVFAYQQAGWATIADLRQSLMEADSAASAHIHGLAVLDRDWYVSQEAFADSPPQFSVREGDALLHFVHGLLHSVGSVSMRPMSLSRYYGKAPEGQLPPESPRE